MTYIIVDELELRRLMQREGIEEFRNYDIEWEFIRMMDYFGELKFDYAVVFEGEDGTPVGLTMGIFAPSRAENDNAC